MSRPLLLCFLALLTLASPLTAGEPSRDLFLPIVGRSVGADGQGFFTALSVTNPGSKRCTARLQFLKSAEPNPNPRSVDLTLGAGETSVSAQLDDQLLGAPLAIGALRIRSACPVVASARTYRLPARSPLSQTSESATFAAIPADAAIGVGENSFISGLVLTSPPAARNKLYVVETTGRSLSYAITLVGAEKSIGRQTLFIRPNEAVALDLDSLFHPNSVPHPALRVSGVNGSGRIVFALVTIASESHDTAAYEMTFRSGQRASIPLWEVIAYGVIAAAIVLAILARIVSPPRTS